MYLLSHQEPAEEALILESDAGARTKMMLARLLQRSEALEDGETLEAAWSKSLSDLQNRASVFLPDAPPAAVVGGGRARGGRRGRGRAGGARGGRGGGRVP